MTPIEALVKARSWCAYQDRCQKEMRDKFIVWGIEREVAESHIASLISEGFIDEERFARSFARGKFRMKGWGKRKIESELKQRGISPYCIRAGMKEISGQEYEKVLRNLAEKAMRRLKAPNHRVKVIKAYKYLLSRGFESDLISRVLKPEFD